MLVFVALPLSNSIGAVSEKKESKSVSLQYVIFKTDGSKTIKEMNVKSVDIDIFNDIVSKIFEKINSKDKFEIEDIINDLELEFGKNKITSIFNMLSGIRPLKKRVFIFSDGYGNKLDLFLKTKISLHKRFTFWYYKNTNNPIQNSRTLIIDPIPDSKLQFFKLVNGMQFGMMTKFTGLYLRIPGDIMKDKQCHTFFFGYAKKVRAFDLPDIQTTL